MFVRTKTHLCNQWKVSKVNFQRTYASLGLQYIIMTSENSNKGRFRSAIYEMIHLTVIVVEHIV